ncbi:hypothetical protein GTA62_18385 [Roseobacter sp. HKCCD9010]|uniref:hypothetical protein n=4 Tax=unclassified Roseobacter TaxID=196798 RepID=UPI0014911805|nr:MULTISPECIES: hypothetical protein [unclassified Roseobacter]NNW00635.1 hypothetical protein [Roseobacter sp. HKCCD6505]NNW17651.1 hypothetical protein [Roseobacter sp. HKCCD8832]NNX02879.1 hypothetical protein [Roseobacter sp. HKCCD9036]NNX57559.1 hypothetical protein [Roseobacter sp. HKCCD8812]NNY08417.1 hypothetical protein [Roseobacter sp. HKCCD9041]
MSLMENVNLSDMRGTASVPAEATAALVAVDAGEVTRTWRDGNDLVVVMADGQETVIEDFFAVEGRELLMRDPETGEIFEVTLNSDGQMIGVEPRSLNQLAEMFGVDATDLAAAIEAAPLEVTKSSQGVRQIINPEIINPEVVPFIIGGLGLIAIIAANSGDDGSGGGSNAADQALDGILNDPANAELDDFKDAGTENVTEDNVSYVKEVIDAIPEEDRDDLTAGDIDKIADIVDEFVPQQADSIAVTVEDDKTTVDIDLDGDGTTDESVVVVVDEDLNVTEIAFDDDNDGTVDRSETYTLDDEGNRVGADFDDDNDGTEDRSETYTLDDEGQIVFTELDNNANDTVDVVSFGNIDSQVDLTAETVADWDISSLDMTNDTAQTITMTAAVLAALADGNADYELIIDGDGNDRVVIEGATATGSSDTDGRVEYEYAGTSGSFFIDSEVTIISSEA